MFLPSYCWLFSAAASLLLMKGLLSFGLLSAGRNTHTHTHTPLLLDWAERSPRHQQRALCTSQTLASFCQKPLLCSENFQAQTGFYSLIDLLFQQRKTHSQRAQTKGHLVRGEWRFIVSTKSPRLEMQRERIRTNWVCIHNMCSAIYSIWPQEELKLEHLIKFSDTLTNDKITHLNTNKEKMEMWNYRLDSLLQTSWLWDMSVYKFMVWGMWQVFKMNRIKRTASISRDTYWSDALQDHRQAHWFPVEV